MTAPDRSPSERGTHAANRRVVQVLLAVAVVAVALAAPARPQGDVDVAFGGGDSTCLAQVVGLAETEILWFDGIPFFQRSDFSGDTHLYVTEAGAPDPTHHLGPRDLEDLAARDATDASLVAPLLVRSGVWYNFTDANGVDWNVTEAYFDVGAAAGLHDVDHHAHADAEPEASAGANGTASGGVLRYYVWIVALAETRDDQNIGVPPDVGDGGKYNFATRVNTSKFTHEARHDAVNVTHDDSTSTHRPGHCHPDSNHTHERFEADLWLGQAPDPVPLDCEPPRDATASFLAEVTVGDSDPSVHGDQRGGDCALDGGDGA